VPPADPSPVTVRRASKGDVSALGRLGALLVATHHAFDAERFISATPRTAQGYGSFLATQLDAPEVVVLVAEREGEVLGYTYAALEDYDYMSLRGPAGVFHDIVVDPATLAALGELGAPQVVLSTAERNEAAQRLFARLGFRRTMVEMTRNLKRRPG
jgi:hypothetical protein